MVSVARKILGQGYRAAHGFLHATLKYNPWVPKVRHGRPVAYGFISEEHLADPALDDQLASQIVEAGAPVEDYRIDVEGYHTYLREANYPRAYHGGGLVEGLNFPEKSLEHFVSAQVLELGPDDIYMDVAADRSPFVDIVKRLWKPRQAYRQDLGYEEGVHGERIGGSAGSLPLPDNSITKAALHCSLEHFEGASDMEMFREMGRVLAPGGRLCVLPFYLAREYTIHTDPIHTLFFGRDVTFDPEARIRYCRWTNRHSRHYDPARLRSRILANLGGLTPKVLRVRNFREVHRTCYLRFVGLFEKPTSHD
ncbi:MAG: hypothetical protein GHCLOJNM_01236 [bacterium]|nr:hypothetical protein [bacterium]